MVLNGPRAYADDICRLFPNFLLTHLQPDVYIRLVEGDGFTIKGTHPFQAISKVLFPEFRRRLFDDDEDSIATAVGE